MQKPRPLWYFMDIYAWVVLAMSIITAFIINQYWVVFIGIIGYLIALLVDLSGGRALGRTGAIRLAQAEQENRELNAEKARLIGAINERDEKLAKISLELSEYSNDKTKE